MLPEIFEGSTSLPEYESLLLSYFGHDMNLQSGDDIVMFIVSASEWLRDVEMSNVSCDILTGILANMSNALNITTTLWNTPAFCDVVYPPLPPRRPFASAGDYYSAGNPPFFAYGDSFWYTSLTEKVWPCHTHTSKNYFPALRQLFHVLAEAYYKQAYIIDSRWPDFLHSCLKKVHMDGICDVTRCPWMTHDYNCHEGRLCPLLVGDSGLLKRAPQPLPGHTPSHEDVEQLTHSSGQNDEVSLEVFHVATEESSPPESSRPTLP